MYIRLGRVRIHIGFPFAAFCAFAANSRLGESLTLVFVSALLHEAGHAAVLLGLGDRSLTLFLSPGGARIESRLSGALPYKNDIAAAAAGPLVNIAIAAGAAMLFSATGGERFIRAAEANIALGAVNLLPMTFLDGGRILSDILLLHMSENRARRICSVCGGAVFFVLCAVCAYLTAAGENTLFLAVFLVYCTLQKTACRHLK